MKCQSCKQENVNSAKFCKNCGKKLFRVQDQTAIDESRPIVPHSSKKKMVMRTVIAAILVIIVGSVIIGIENKINSERQLSEFMQSSTPTPAVQQPTGQMQPPPPAPVAQELKSNSNTWHFANKSGYSYDFTIKIWDPITDAKSGTSSHPANSENILGSACDFDSTTDVAIPVQFIVKDTTANFSSDISANVEFDHDGKSMFDSRPYQGNGIPPANEDGRLSVEQFFSKGPECETHASSGLDPGASLNTFGVTWNSLNNGDNVTSQFFIIVHKYFSPATPKGDKALLDWITIRPWGGNDSMAFTDTDSKYTISDVGMTLSGDVVKPSKPKK